MNRYILQVNYRRDLSRSPDAAELQAVADAIAATPGLRWKIWLFNESTGEGGGIYLFEDVSALNAFVHGPIATTLKTDPRFSDLSVKSFGIMEELSALTHGPI